MSIIHDIVKKPNLNFEHETEDDPLLQKIDQTCQTFIKKESEHPLETTKIFPDAATAVDNAFEQGKLMAYQRQWALEFAECDIKGFCAEMEKRTPSAPRQLSQLALNFTYPLSGSTMAHARLNLKQITALSGLSEQQLNTLLKGECLHD